MFDATGVSEAFITAMEMVRPMGQITKVGWGHQPLAASLDPLVKKAVTVQGSFSHTHATWERVVALLTEGKIPADLLVGYQAPLSGWHTGFERMHTGEVAKAVLVP